jgi:hypothetical protein
MSVLSGNTPSLTFLALVAVPVGEGMLLKLFKL